MINSTSDLQSPGSSQASTSVCRLLGDSWQATAWEVGLSALPQSEAPVGDVGTECRITVDRSSGCSAACVLPNIRLVAGTHFTDVSLPHIMVTELRYSPWSQQVSGYPERRLLSCLPAGDRVVMRWGPTADRQAIDLQNFALSNPPCCTLPERLHSPFAAASQPRCGSSRTCR